jgi:hypothetical protein
MTICKPSEQEYILLIAHPCETNSDHIIRFENVGEDCGTASRFSALLKFKSQLRSFLEAGIY